MIRLSFIFSCLCASLFALSPAQRAMVKQQNTSISQRPVMKGTLKEVIGNGRVLILNNDSKWVVSPEDTEYTGGWLGPAPIIITVEGSSTEQFPYSLKNTWTGKSVRARRWSKDMDERELVLPHQERSPSPSK